MEEGVLCLKWRDHRSTFLRMLSSTRKKGAFCDATLVCEGKFYPVHQLVLSTCSEYFQQMFDVIGAGTSKTAGLVHTTVPLMVVLAGVSQRDLEALLEYMYAGETTILQGELTHFMRAAEGLKIRGLAEPAPAAPTSPSPREAGEGTKRPISQCEDTWGPKRKRECGGSQKTPKRRTLEDIVSPAQLAAVELAPEEQCGMERDMATGTPGDLPGAVAPLSPPVFHPEVKYEEVQVKYEPQDLEEEEETTNQEREWSHHQGKRQHRQHKATALEDGGDTAQLLGFCDPGLTYLAHSSGLGALTDPGHPSHHPANLHPRRMGRPTSEIWLHYIIERAAGKTAVYCRYCTQKYGYPNATKMKIHTMKCAKCPEEVKSQFEGTMKPDAAEGQDITLGRLGSDGGVTAKPDSVQQYQLHQSQQAMERPSDGKNAAGRAKSGFPRAEVWVENPSISVKAGCQSSENSSPTKSQNSVQQDALSKHEGISATKSKQRQYPNPEKSASSKASSSSPEKTHSDNVIPPSKAQQQHSKPLSRPDDRVSLRSEQLCHPPVY